MICERKSGSCPQLCLPIHCRRPPPQLTKSSCAALTARSIFATMVRTSAKQTIFNLVQSSTDPVSRSSGSKAPATAPRRTASSALSLSPLPRYVQQSCTYAATVPPSGSAERRHARYGHRCACGRSDSTFLIRYARSADSLNIVGGLGELRGYGSVVSDVQDRSRT